MGQTHSDATYTMGLSEGETGRLIVLSPHVTAYARLPA